MFILNLSPGPNKFVFEGSTQAPISLLDPYIGSLFEERDRPGAWISYVPDAPIPRPGFQLTHLTPGKTYFIYSLSSIELFFE